MNNKSSLLNRAKQLGTGTAVATAAILSSPSAEANNLTLDYSFSAEYSNSGWFMQNYQDGDADGIVLDNGFKLWGEVERTDSIFWRWDNEEQKSVPRYDITGFGMAWGGRILGPTTWEDVLSTPYEYSVDFSHFDSNDFYTYANSRLTIGYSNQEYTFSEYNSTPLSNSSNYTQNDYSYYAPGQYDHSGDISVGLSENDGSQSLYWFAVLTVEWGNEPVSPRYWDGQNYSHLDGDTFKLTVPQNSIDVTFDPILGSTNPSGPSSVPDAGSFYGIFGLLGLGLFLRARKR